MNVAVLPISQLNDHSSYKLANILHIIISGVLKHHKVYVLLEKMIIQ